MCGRLRAGPRLRCQDIQLVHGDVRIYDVPDDVTVAFFFNPFEGETFAEVIDRLLASVDRNPRVVRIVYVNPTGHSRLMATGRVQLVKRIMRPRPGRAWARRAAIHLYYVLPEDTDWVQSPRSAPAVVGWP